MNTSTLFQVDYLTLFSTYSVGPDRVILGDVREEVKEERMNDRTFLG